MILAGNSLLPQVSLIVAISLFTGIIVWLWVTPRMRWRRDSEIPLRDAPVQPRPGPTTEATDHPSPRSRETSP